MELVSVAAVAENGVIGKDGEVPWHLPEDKQQYRALVAEHPVILGRTTFESMRDALPGRVQIVMSRRRQRFDEPSVYAAGSVAEAVGIAESVAGETVYVIGGADIYALFQPHLDRMVLTRVPGEFDGDVYYPEWDPNEWRLVEATAYDGFTVEEWVRQPRDE